MRSLRFTAFAVAAAAVLAFPAFGGTPTVFPTVYDCTVVTKQTTVATAAGRTITNREEFTSAGPLTFLDGRTLSLDTGDPFDLVARYRITRKGTVRFSLTRETRRLLLKSLRSTLRSQGIRGTATLESSRGSGTFSEDGSALTGKQTLRIGFSGTYRGIGIELVSVARMKIAGTLAP